MQLEISYNQLENRAIWSKKSDEKTYFVVRNTMATAAVKSPVN